jgi:hypothetical protein
VNTAAPTISGTAAVGQVLTCNVGIWSGSAITYEFQWLRSGTPIASARSATYAVVAADDGTPLSCLVRATAGTLSTDVISAAVTVGGGGSVGTGPVNTTPPTIVGAAAVGQNLVCTSGTWTGIGVTYSYQWLRSGEAIACATSSTYTVTAADSGTSLSCLVRASITTGSTELVSAGVTVGGNSNGPVNTVAPAIAGTPEVGQRLNCSSGIWSGLGISYTYQWRRAGVAIASAISSTYRVTAADSGAALSCVVRAAHGWGAVEVASAAVVVGGGGSGAGPVNPVAPSINGTAAVGQVLTCSPGTWNGAGLTFAYQWHRAGAPIGSATLSTYTVSVADSGAALTCVVRASNTSASTEAVSASVTVAGSGGGSSVPVNVVPPSIAGTAAVGQVLTCVAGTWSFGGVGVTYGYQWVRGGVPIGSATSASYTVASGDAGQVLSCVVRASNSSGSTDAVSGSVTVGSGGGGGGGGVGPGDTVPPTISGVSAPGQVLTCNPPALNGVTFEYRWRLSGSSIPRATWATYTVLSSDLSGSLSCSVVAYTSSGVYASTSTSVAVTGWSGHSPGNSVGPWLSGTAAFGQALTCNPGAWHGLPDLSYATKWQRNGADISGAVGQSYLVAAGDVGKQLNCVVIVSNGYGKGALASGAVTVT